MNAFIQSFIMGMSRSGGDWDLCMWASYRGVMYVCMVLHVSGGSDGVCDLPRVVVTNIFDSCFLKGRYQWPAVINRGRGGFSNPANFDGFILGSGVCVCVCVCLGLGPG